MNQREISPTIRYLLLVAEWEEKTRRKSEHDSDRKIDSEHDSVKLLWIFCIGVRSRTGP